MSITPLWLRRIWLSRALRDYSPYNPPYTIEERLLSMEKAIDNFRYFMDVRGDRLKYFISWLENYFSIEIKLDMDGMKTLNKWGNAYAGLLLSDKPKESSVDSFFSYEPLWTGKNSGNNIVFDIGILLGEAFILNCPKLFWAIEPTRELLPRQSSMMKKAVGASFQRPKLTGFENPAYELSPLHEAYIFSRQMQISLVSLKGKRRFKAMHKKQKSIIIDSLFNSFVSSASFYPAGDPYNLLDKMSYQQYLYFLEDEDLSDGIS